ncbi:MAG: hypothetical protein ACR2GG_07585 [Gemmatimonadaceae bacterium]
MDSHDATVFGHGLEPSRRQQIQPTLALVPTALLVNLLRFGPYVLGLLTSYSGGFPETLAAYEGQTAELPDEAVE